MKLTIFANVCIHNDITVRFRKAISYCHPCNISNSSPTYFIVFVFETFWNLHFDGIHQFLNNNTICGLFEIAAADDIVAFLQSYGHSQRGQGN